MEGKIIKGIGGFYYVQTSQGLVECKARGSFRKDKKKPTVGDMVKVRLLDGQPPNGSVEEILPRKNLLVRPAVANVDQALIIFASVDPEPNFNLLDRFLVMMEKQNVPTVICFNKTDLADNARMRHLEEIYGSSGYPLHFISVQEKKGLSDLREILSGKTTVLAGPSGVESLL